LGPSRKAPVTFGPWLDTLSLMIRTPHKAAVLAVAAAAVVSLSGCQAGQAAQTSQSYNPVDGRNINQPVDAGFGDPYMGVRDAAVVALNDNATLVVTLVNNTLEADQLESASLDGTPLDLSETILIDSGSSVSMGFGDNPTATTSNLDAKIGDWVELELHFASSGIVHLNLLVLPYGDQYEPVTFGPAARDSRLGLESPSVDYGTN